MGFKNSINTINNKNGPGTTEPPKKSHKCALCPKTFEKPSLLRRHQVAHTGQKQFACPVCTKKFSQKSSLDTHTLLHSGVKPYLCLKCNQRFSQRGNLKLHFKRVHSLLTIPKTAKLFNCDKCSCHFKTFASLSAHLTKRHVRKTVEEEESPQNFFQEFEAQKKPTESQPQETQEQTINPETPSKDSRDNKTTDMDVVVTFPENYVEIIDSVTGKKMTVEQKKINGKRFYICSVCEKPFNRPSDLIRHHRVHTGQRPFVCLICNRGFKTNGNLKDHEKVHLKTLQTEATEDLVQKTRKQLTEIKNLLKSNEAQEVDQESEPIELVVEDAPEMTAIVMGDEIISHQTLQPLNLSKNEEVMVILLDSPEPVNQGIHRPVQTNQNFISLDSILKKNLKVRSNFLVKKLDDTQPNLGVVTEQNLNGNMHKAVDPGGKDVLEVYHLQEPTVREKTVKEKVPEEKTVENEKEPATTHKVSEQPLEQDMSSNKRTEAPKLKNKSSCVCDVCMKKFNKPSDLARHLRTHSKERPFSCQICSKTFTLKGNLTTHLKTHDSQRESFNCNVCDSSFSCKASLDVHRRIHANVLPYKCIYCDKKFRTAGNRTKHHRVHQRLAVQQCKRPENVQIRTSSISQLLSKMVDEENGPENEQSTQPTYQVFFKTVANQQKSQTVYECQYEGCGKQFGSNSLLVRHELVHTREKKYQCVRCLKFFSQKSHLIDHALVHSDERKFECKHCRTSYKFRSGLTSHYESNPKCRPES